MYITSAHSIHLSALKECTHLGEKKNVFFVSLTLNLKKHKVHISLKQMRASLCLMKVNGLTDTLIWKWLNEVKFGQYFLWKGDTRILIAQSLQITTQTLGYVFPCFLVQQVKMVRLITFKQHNFPQQHMIWAIIHVWSTDTVGWWTNRSH